MDDRRFDQWTRALPTVSGPRAARRPLFGAIIGTILTQVGLEEASARCVKVGKACDRGDRCCGQARCRRRKCQCLRGRTACGKKCCAREQLCAGGRCVTGQADCPAGADNCVLGPDDGFLCRNTLACGCFQRRQGGTRCVQRAIGTAADQCATDADCRNLGFPAGSSCVRDEGGFCGGTNSGRGQCMAPCNAG